jgi:hypothetical protein
MTLPTGDAANGIGALVILAEPWQALWVKQVPKAGSCIGRNTQKDAAPSE